MFPLSEWDTEYRKISSEWRDIVIMSKLNKQLYDNLIHSISWLLKYAKDNNIQLPDKHELVISMGESQEILDRIAQSTETLHQKNQPQIIQNLVPGSVNLWGHMMIFSPCQRSGHERKIGYLLINTSYYHI